MKRAADAVWFEIGRPQSPLRVGDHRGFLLHVWRAFLDQFNDVKKIRWYECCVDGMFVTAKKGAIVRA
jgi:hypothetical protein